ncbi:MAG: protein translocase subunit SecD [Desulfobacterota bacterium]|nr:protein translocase subunit SecD [Thermodesulfobacteriota bacterium]MDW8002698.1 protein translocase subunit SecD [Deltaproteobacteria bacterium]
MLRSLKFRFTLVAVFLLISCVYCLPNFVEIKGSLKKYLPTDKINLGLDLKGGIHLLLEMDTEKLLNSVMDRKVETLKDSMIRHGVRFLSLGRKETEITVSLRPEHKDRLFTLVMNEFPDLKFVNQKEKIDEIEVTFVLPENHFLDIKENATLQALEIIRNRIDQFGVVEPVITKEGEDRILIQLPGVKDPQRALDVIGKTAMLEFKLVDEENMKTYTGGPPPEGSEVLPMRVKSRETGVETKVPILLKKQTVLTGEFLTDASVKIGGELGSEPYVALEFNSEGARIFERITAENVGRRLAIILDNVVYSAPVIKERISGGKASITGAFTMDEAKDLAIVLRAGALPAPVKVVQNITIGPTLGQDSIRRGVRASILGALLVVGFMVFYYRGSGVIANIALLLNMIYLFGAFTALKATLTLPGIAGIILTIGMGVDTNVLIFERIREELRLGKTPRAAIESGYEKAWVTIFDSHVTTLITTFILFIFGTGPIRGFAVTLSIGIIINLFTAVFGSKAIFDWIIMKYKPRSLSI